MHCVKQRQSRNIYKDGIGLDQFKKERDAILKSKAFAKMYADNDPKKIIDDALEGKGEKIWEELKNKVKDVANDKNNNQIENELINSI